MPNQRYIVSVSHRTAKENAGQMTRHAVVGEANIATVERALSKAPEAIRDTIRKEPAVQSFVEGKLGPKGCFRSGVFIRDHEDDDSYRWSLAIGTVDEVL